MCIKNELRSSAETGNRPIGTDISQKYSIPEADPESSAGGGRIMASAIARAYMGVWGLAPSGVQGQSPWSGGQGTKSP